MECCEVEHIIVIDIGEGDIAQQLYSYEISLDISHTHRNQAQLRSIVVDRLDGDYHIRWVTPKQAIKNLEAYSEGSTAHHKGVCLWLGFATLNPMHTHFCNITSWSSDQAHRTKCQK